MSYMATYKLNAFVFFKYNLFQLILDGIAIEDNSSHLKCVHHCPKVMRTQVFGLLARGAGGAFTVAVLTNCAK